MTSKGDREQKYNCSQCSESSRNVRCEDIDEMDEMEYPLPVPASPPPHPTNASSLFLVRRRLTAAAQTVETAKPRKTALSLPRSCADDLTDEFRGDCGVRQWATGNRRSPALTSELSRIRLSVENALHQRIKRRQTLMMLIIFTPKTPHR